MNYKDNSALPKVLVCTVIPFSDNGLQHSLAEMFSCWDKSKLSMVYARAELPDTKCCDTFFRINENAIIKSIFNRKIKTSSRVSNIGDGVDAVERAEAEAEKRRYSNISSHKRKLLVYAREIVWKLGKWKTPELTEFLDEVSPDIVFLQLLTDVYMSRIEKFIADYTQKPVVCYIADDNVTYKSVKKTPLTLLRRYFTVKYNRYLIEKSQRVFVMAPKAKRELDELYGIDCDILTKSIDFNNIHFKEVKPKAPLKLLYTGALTIGREGALIQIARAVAQINKEGNRLSFEIYSGDVPSKKGRDAFSRGGCRFCGKSDHRRIIELQGEADILVYAETLKKPCCRQARLSFSTKLTDYFAVGKCIFALGVEDIAPIEYLRDEDAALVVTSYGDIEEKLRELCDNPELVAEYGKKAFECGKRNHSSEKVFREFKEKLISVKDLHSEG